MATEQTDEQTRDGGHGEDARAPEGPSDLKARSWWATLKRAFSEFSDDNGTDWAAALTCYAVLSLFPALVALLGLVSLVMDPQTLVTNTTAIIGQLGARGRGAGRAAHPA